MGFRVDLDTTQVHPKTWQRSVSLHILGGGDKGRNRLP